jgi:DNA-binding transcriptional ArsR family regulator
MGIPRPYIVPRRGRLYSTDAEILRHRPLAEIVDDASLAPRLRLAARRALREADKEILPAKTELFAMLRTGNHRDLMRYLREHSRHPMIAAELFSLCVHHMDWDRMVPLSRSALAAELGVSPGVVSRVMGELSKCGAIERIFADELGNRTRTVRYRVNAKIVAYGPSSADLDKARSEAPPLRFHVVGGTDLPPTERRSRAPVAVLPVPL